MRTTKKRVNGAAAAVARRVVVDFPAQLLSRMERAVAELATTRSELIRLAVEQYLDTLQQEKPQRELAEGYAANAFQALSACEDLAHVESDLA